MLLGIQRAIARPLSMARSAAVARQKRAPRAIWCPYRVHPREGPKSLRNRNSGQQPAQTPPLHPVGACGANTGQGCVGFARSRTIRALDCMGLHNMHNRPEMGGIAKLSPQAAESSCSEAANRSGVPIIPLGGIPEAGAQQKDPQPAQLSQLFH